MDFIERIDSILNETASGALASDPNIIRVCAEIDFAKRFIDVYPDLKDEWQKLVVDSAAKLQEAANQNTDEIVSSIEQMLLPIGVYAKKYTIYCCGHAHIDMNWTWPWIETIAISRDTFATTDKLMNEFPDLTFAQSQISIYAAMKKYAPEIFDIIKKRIAEGRWESTAAMWVESDKNMASGESICRHMLYSKLWMKENLGFEFNDLKVSWEGDTFGHPWTMPAILKSGGISRYYHCRPTMPHWLSRWQSPDGSEVMEFCDKGWYNGDSNPSSIAANFIDYTKETGLFDFLWIVGVGDHGGGPTREDLKKLRDMKNWPIYPVIRFGTVSDYFSVVEKCYDQIRVFNNELNSVFEGCYTSQSKVKLINRTAENILPDAEIISVFAELFADIPYPRTDLREAWQNMLFNQFHDILSGSSGHEAMEEAVVRFREAEALSGTIKIRSLKEIAARINTSGFRMNASSDEPYGDTIGHGSGEIRIPSRTSTMSMGSIDCEPVVVFNTLPFSRSGLAAIKVWDRSWDASKIAVVDDEGNMFPAQLVGFSRYAHYQGALNIVFPASNVPAMGYRSYSIQPVEEPIQFNGVSLVSENIIENEYLRVEVDPESGAIKHLIDKNTSFDYVPEGKLMGLLEMYQEAPHIMTAWDIGEITDSKAFTSGGHPVSSDDLRYINEIGDSLGMVYSRKGAEAGPYRASIRTMHEKGDTWIVVEAALDAGSKSVEINVATDWRETGTPKTGVPMLKMAFASNISDTKATYEIPFGSITRPTNGAEVSALRWADISGTRQDGSVCGFTLLNDCKYGFSADDNTMRATLLRSTYDPDPVPEIGMHHMRFSIVPHEGACSVSESMRIASDFNLPMSPVITSIHDGILPASGSGGEMLSANVIAAAVKKAETTDGILIRMYEVEGEETVAQFRLPNELTEGAYAYEVDTMEQRLPVSSAVIKSGELNVNIPPYGIVSVIIEKK